jgi:hypothetical protein
MGLVKKSLKGLGVLVVVTAGLSVVNIIQAGKRSPDGRSMADIIGKDPNEATFDDIEKLSRADKMQLFYAAEAPAFESMKGEYQGKLLSGGVLGHADDRDAVARQGVQPRGGKRRMGHQRLQREGRGGAAGGLLHEEDEDLCGSLYHREGR